MKLCLLTMPSILSAVKTQAAPVKQAAAASRRKRFCLAWDHSKPIIVIDHQPKELQTLADAGADVDLSGHTHDGQIFPGNILTSLMWENSCGLLSVDSMTSVVTSGAGVWGPNMRVGTKSEIVQLRIHF